MKDHAVAKLDEIGNEPTFNNCARNDSSCPGTGYNSAQDTPNCG